MNVPFFQRLSFIQARKTLLFVFLLAVIVAAVQIFSDFHTHRRETESMLRQVMAMQKESAALAAWGLDSASAERVVGGLLHYGAIRKVSLVSDSGLILAAQERPRQSVGVLDRLARSLFEDLDYTAELHIHDTQKPIGSLSFTSDGAVIAVAFVERTVNNLIASAVLLVVLSVVLVMMFHRLLTRPLAQLCGELAVIDIERPARAPLTTPRGHGGDELGLVVATINRLLEKIERSLEERRQVEKELQAAEQKYRSIFDNAIEGIYQISFSGRFLSVNPALAGAIGYDSPQQLMDGVVDIGRQLYAEPAQWYAFLSVLQRDGYVVNIETPFLRRDGSTLWASQSARIVRDGQSGAALFIEGTVADISGSKKAMADLARVEAQLMQAQKMEALGNLAGGIAHDFNNLLQIISGTVQLLLLKKKEGDEDYRQLREVHLAAGRAADLVRRMLTFSRKVEARKVSLDLNEAVDNALHLLQRTVPKMIELRADLAEGLPAIAADPLQIEQVLVNLANNGVQAMEEGGRLTMVTELLDLSQGLREGEIDLSPGSYVRLRVTDSGHGMDEETRRRIFEPFFTTKPPGKGSGLGLSSVYGIVSAHGGQIACRSQPGRGSVFDVYLPVIAAEGGGRAEERRVPEIGGTETILVVDDESTILDIAGEIFRQHGYRVLTAFSGEEAVRLYEESGSGIDLVLLDLGMPGMGGKKCLEVLRGLNPQVKVIIASGYGSYDLARDPEACGAAAFLAKPYRLDVLLATTRQVLDSRQGPAGLVGN